MAASDLIVAPANVKNVNAAEDTQEWVAQLLRENDELREEIARLLKFREIAFQDELTGLPNRRYFEQRFLEAAAAAEREPDQPFSVVVLDMDHLKLLNDRFGHAEGDRALKHFATKIREALRDGDTCARVGGDEFMLLLPKCSHESCLELMERLAVHCAPKPGEFPVPVRLSMGAATSGRDHVTVGELCGLADQRMYQDKAAQRDTQKDQGEAAPGLSASVWELVQTVALHVPPVAWPQVIWHRVEPAMFSEFPGLAMLDKIGVAFRERKHELMWEKT